MRRQFPGRRLKHAERPDFLRRDIRRKGDQHLPMRAVAVADLDLVPAHVAVDRAVAMKDIQRPLRPNRDTANRPAGVGLVEQKPIELGLHPKLHAYPKRPARGRFSRIIFAVPHERLR